MDCKQRTQLLKSQIVKQQLAYQGKWLGMKLVTYSIGQRINPNYQCVFRTTKKQNCRTDGVEIVPIIKYKDRKSQVVLIANYRPPVKSFCLQFPSGLVQDDNYEQNVKRQLLEQTGYVLKKTIQMPLPTLYIDPWKSNQSTILFIGIIDGDDPQHRQEPTLQAGENIRVITLTLDQNLPKTINELAQKYNYLIQGKLWSIITGLVLNSILQ